LDVDHYDFKRSDVLYEIEVPAKPIVCAMGERYFTPIKTLNLFSKDWCIYARVTKKHPLRVTHKGGHILKTEIMDSEGSQIEAMFFNDSA
jgi:hypothetical protein